MIGMTLKMDKAIDNWIAILTTTMKRKTVVKALTEIFKTVPYSYMKSIERLRE